MNIGEGVSLSINISHMYIVEFLVCRRLSEAIELKPFLHTPMYKCVFINTHQGTRPIYGGYFEGCLGDGL